MKRRGHQILHCSNLEHAGIMWPWQSPAQPLTITDIGNPTLPPKEVDERDSQKDEHAASGRPAQNGIDNKCHLSLQTEGGLTNSR